jgi:hypothetical protein
MKSSLRFLGLLLALVLATTTGLQAQKLTPGTWTGKGVDPGGEEFPFTVEVENAGDSLSMALIGPDGERLPLTNIRFNEGKLLFQWEPGVVVNCELSPIDGGAYSGPCSDESGGTGQITITPPQP